MATKAMRLEGLEWFPRVLTLAFEKIASTVNAPAPELAELEALINQIQRGHTATMALTTQASKERTPQAWKAAARSYEPTLEAIVQAAEKLRVLRDKCIHGVEGHSVESLQSIIGGLERIEADMLWAQEEILDIIDALTPFEPTGTPLSLSEAFEGLL